MAPKSLSTSPNARAIETFLAAHMGMVHREDIGPLFGQVALLGSEIQPDALTRRYWAEAVSAAIATEPHEMLVGRVHWTRALATDERRSTPSRAAASLHRVRAGIRSAGRTPR